MILSDHRYQSMNTPQDNIINSCLLAKGVEEFAIKEQDTYRKLALKHDRFWHTYCDYISRKVWLNFYELVPEIVPVIIEFPQPLADWLTEKLLYIRSLLSEIVEEDNYIVVILASPTSTRIQLPYCHLPLKIINEYIIAKLSLKSPYDNPIALYGSSPYVLQHIFNLTKEVVEEVDITTVFTPYYHKHVMEDITKDIIELHELTYWLPLFLSVHYYPQPAKVRLSLGLQKVTRLVQITSQYMLHIDDNTISYFLTLLTPERIRNSYLEIGKALYNYYLGNERGLKLWIELWPERYEYCYNMYYYRFQLNNPLTIKTIAWYISIDKPEEYAKWHSSWYIKPLHNLIEEPRELSLAESIYRFYWLHLINSDENKRDFWYFDGIRWLNDNTKLKQLIYNNYNNVLIEYKNYLVQNRIDKDKTNKIFKLIDKLYKNKNDIFNHLADLFYEPNFSRYKDYDPRLIATDNCVLEVNKDSVTVRRAKPEDYLTRSTHTKYDSTLTWNSPLVQECMYWFTQLFPDPDEKDLREYFLRVMSSILRYGNKEKALYVMYGKKDGAKSTIKRLIELTLGDYTHTIPTTAFMGKSTSGPSPEMSLSKGTLVDFIQEPDEHDQLRNGLVKMLTGNDTFFSRLLYDNGEKIKPTFKLFLMCNKIPNVPLSDEALKERLIIIPFRSTWSLNAPNSKEEQFRQRKFPIEVDFEEEKLPILASVMLWIMVNYYVEYVKHGLGKRPDIVNKFIQQYWEDNDFYVQFQHDCIVKCTGQIVKVNTIYNEFKLWFSNAFPNLKPPNLLQFKDAMSKRLGSVVNGGWEGYQLVNSEY